MKLSIINGTWNLQSLDGTVHLTVQPRRASDGAATNVTLRAEPMPALVIHPESILDASPVEAWVWNGSTVEAHRIISRVMKAVRIRLDPGGRESARVRAWRERVLSSLFPGSSSAEGVSQQA